MILTEQKSKVIAFSGEYTTENNYKPDGNKLIEFAGRICYKSDMSNDTIGFIDNILKNKHFSVLEHSWDFRMYETISKEYQFLNYLYTDDGVVVAGNKRAFLECGASESYQYINASNFFREVLKKKAWHMLSATAHLICNRGVSHELVRHRVASYSQESTRYCNYSKNKFNNELTYIIPHYISDLKPGSYNKENKPEFLSEESSEWFDCMLSIEESYMNLLKMGKNAQEARGILPNDLKTEIVVTASLEEWKHIFMLRLSKKAHPQIREVLLETYNGMKMIAFGEVFKDLQVDGNVL